MSIYNLLPNKFIFNVVLVLMLFKIFFYFLFKIDQTIITLGGGGDANYYDLYALGYLNFSTSIWPDILRFLNEFGLYSRSVISYFFLFLNLLIIPFLIARISNLNFIKDQKIYLYSLFICLLYPTLFFYTFDICRDVLMVFSFLIGCLMVKKSLNSQNLLIFVIFFVLAVVAGLWLYELRGYLGFSFLVALFLWKIKLTKKRLVIFTFLYFLALFAANYLGLFVRLTGYRNGFEEMGGGSTLGLDFSNPVMFIPNFFLSIMGQLLGLYITNPLAVVMFLIETLPFFLMLIYVVKNIRFADNFIRFLITFFVLYASVWLIANDNLGTALRLRMFNYFAIYICFFYILKLKKSISLQQVIKE